MHDIDINGNESLSQGIILQKVTNAYFPCQYTSQIEALVLLHGSNNKNKQTITKAMGSKIDKI